MMNDERQKQKNSANAELSSFRIQHSSFRYKPYPKYKPSGVEWLGDVPEGWEVKRLKYAAKINPTKSEVSHLPPDMEVSFLPMEKVGEDGTMNLDTSKPIEEVYQGFTYFAEHDVVVAKITPCFENGKGALCKGLTNELGFGTTEFHVIRRTEATYPAYLFYLSKSENFRESGTALMKGTAGQKRVTDDFISNYLLGFPSLPEQHAIAAFLDRETARIDRLVEKKRRLIDLLREKRTALISEMVTGKRSLVRDTDTGELVAVDAAECARWKKRAPEAVIVDATRTKPSGVEWLGDVPEEWEVKRLKHISPKQGVGLVINPSTYVDDNGTVPFLFGADIDEYQIFPENARRITEESNNRLKPSMLHTDDLVTIRVGYPGITAVVPPELEGSNCASIMITRGHESFVSDWLCYAMNSPVGKYQVEVVQYGAAQKQFNIAHAVEFRYLVPPYEAQQALVEYLQSECRKVGDLITKIETAIAKLTEYRSALISAAVTGKIDVRGEE